MSDGSTEIESGIPLQSPASSDELDSLLRLLANDRRRIVLRTLVESDEESIPFSRLVTAVAQAEGRDERQSVRVDLHHCQLPPLTDAELVEYDPQTSTVRYLGDDAVETVLEQVSALR